MSKKKLLPAFLFTLLLSGLNFAYAESKFFRLERPENKEIDSLIVLADRLYENDEYDNALLYFDKIIEMSESQRYSKGLTKGYLGCAGIYFIKNKLDISTALLLKAKEEPYAQESPEEMYSILFREGLNLHSLGLYDEAVKRYKESLNFSGKIPNKEEQLDKLVGVYINLGDIFQLKSLSDSAFYYYKTAYYSQTTNFNNKFTSSISISDLYIDNGKLDSAQKYLDVAEFYSEKLNSDFSESLLNQIKGKFYKASGDFDNAIVSFKKSLELNEKINRPYPKLFKLLSETYSKQGNETLANSYLRKYVEMQEGLAQTHQQNMKVPILIANRDNANKVEKAESNTQLVIVSFGIILLLVLLMIYLYVKKQKKKSQNRKNENQQLKKKLNNAFDEVTELAATNSPNFLSRFVEVYPEFYNLLTTEYPTLTTADLKLCALMKLDFSTKEIAEISFSSLRTVQNRKYKLRKKFGLETEENINQWIQNFHVQSLMPA